MNKISKKIIEIARKILSYKIKLTDDQKDSLNNHITKIRSDKFSSQDEFYLKDLFYRLLTNTSNNQFKKYNFTQQQQKKYESYIEKLFPINDGMFAQVYFNKNLSIKDHKTYNYYVNIQFESQEDVKKYMNSLYPLMTKVKQLSDKYKCYIGFKTFMKLLSLVGHNDTLKFYYYDKNDKLKVELQQLVNNYIIENNFKRGTRLYDHGIDIQDDNHNKSSFGERLSTQIFNIFIKWIKDNKDKYTNEELIKSFQRDINMWIQNTAKKLIK